MPSNKRVLNYHRLRRAGFNSKDATKFKDYSEEYVLKLIRLQEQFKKEMQIALKKKVVNHG